MSTRRKIFLDVGAHVGETLEEVIKDEYLFDVIHCFEPMPQPFAKLVARFGQSGGKSSCRRIFLHNFGLSDLNGEKEIYGQGLGASLFSDKKDVNLKQSTLCRFVRASDFFREHLTQHDLVVMKLNCEGAEIAIMQDLLDERQAFKITNVMIDFDARKIPHMAKKPKELLRRFKREGFKNYSLCRGVMRGKTHEQRIRNWLSGLFFADKIMRHPPSIFLRARVNAARWKNLLPF